MELINVRRYYPEEMPLGDDVQYFIDESGRDWYESLTLFTKPYSITYDKSTGVIHSYSTDVSALYPAGLNVVDLDEIPNGFDIAGGWVYADGAVVKRSQSHAELVSEAETEKSQHLDEAATAIAPLQDAVDLGIATDEEAELLLDWKRYRVEVNRIDTNLAPDITWPVPPVSKVRF